MADQRPPLPPAAEPVWQAYRAMQLSKRQHFEYLQQLEERYQPYGRPSATEQQRLQTLLDTHDARVEQFRSALSRLREDHPDDFPVLLRWLQEDG